MSFNDPNEIPSVTKVLQCAEVGLLSTRYGRAQTLQALRGELGRLRARLRAGEPIDGALALPALAARVAEQLDERRSGTLVPLINCTGVVLHTNLGRAPMARAALEAALRAYFARTFLREARMLRVSAHSGEGIPPLRAAIAALLETAEPPAIADGAFLPVDRVFSLAGRGTVVTGTLRRGTLARGVEIEILPAGIRTFVRQLQVHGRDAEVVLPGQRVGINLRGVAAESAGRGSVVATPGLMTPSALMEVELAPGPTFKPGRLLRVLMGTSESPARLRMPRGGCARPKLRYSPSSSTFTRAIPRATARASPHAGTPSATRRSSRRRSRACTELLKPSAAWCGAPASTRLARCRPASAYAPSTSSTLFSPAVPRRRAPRRSSAATRAASSAPPTRRPRNSPSRRRASACARRAASSSRYSNFWTPRASRAARATCAASFASDNGGD